MGGSRSILWLVGHRWFHRKLLRAFGYWRCSLDFSRCIMGQWCRVSSKKKHTPWLFRSFFRRGDAIEELNKGCHGNHCFDQDVYWNGDFLFFFLVAQGGLCCLFFRNLHLWVGSSSRPSLKSVESVLYPGHTAINPPKDVEMHNPPTGFWTRDPYIS